MKIEDRITNTHIKGNHMDYVEEILQNIEESVLGKNKNKLKRNLNEFTRITTDYKDALGQDNLVIYLNKFLKIAARMYWKTI